MDNQNTTDQYYVIGNPVAHSLSPEIHAQFAQQTQQTLVYERLCVPKDAFRETLDQLRKTNLKGANITVPFKQLAWQYAEQLTHRAQLAGAVNTLKFTVDGICLGDNTDGIGLVTDIIQNLTWPLAGKRILIVGAGGATRGILKALLDEQPVLIVLANRTASKAIELAADFAGYGPLHAHPDSLANLPNEPFDLIINATSASLSDTRLPLPTTIVTPATACYDLFYSAAPTVFLQWAAECGSLHRADGLGMLVEQAAESFYLWRGVKPTTAPVLTWLRNTLAQRRR